MNLELLITPLLVQLLPYVSRAMIALLNLLVDALPDEERDFIWGCLEIIKQIGLNDAIRFEDKKRYARDAILVLETHMHRIHDPTLFARLSLGEE